MCRRTVRTLQKLNGHQKICLDFLTLLFLLPVFLPTWWMFLLLQALGAPMHCRTDITQPLTDTTVF